MEKSIISGTKELMVEHILHYVLDLGTVKKKNLEKLLNQIMKTVFMQIVHIFENVKIEFLIEKV
jgi:hypothetical protein